MEFNNSLDRRRPGGAVFVWNEKFKTRLRKQHSSDRNKVEAQPSESIVTAFLKEQRSGLDPPQYQYTALRAFLDKANEADLVINPPAGPYALKVALVDDRCDRTGWQDVSGEHYPARNWDLYAPFPPPGDFQHLDLLNAGKLIERCKANVSVISPYIIARLICLEGNKWSRAPYNVSSKPLVAVNQTKVLEIYGGHDTIVWACHPV